MVHVERAGKLQECGVQFKDDAHLIRVIERICSRVGRRIDATCPLVDARLPDGSRVNAVIPPVAVDGPLLSIRRFGKDALQAETLVKNLSMTEGMLTLLKACVKARLNIIVSGGTGAGKTTLLNILSELHRRYRAGGHHRRCRGTAVAAAACGAHGSSPRERRRRRGHPHQAACHQRPPHASRPHHRGRGARRGMPSTCSRP